HTLRRSVRRQCLNLEGECAVNRFNVCPRRRRLIQVLYRNRNILHGKRCCFAEEQQKRNRQHKSERQRQPIASQLCEFLFYLCQNALHVYSSDDLPSRRICSTTAMKTSSNEYRSSCAAVT